MPLKPVFSRHTGGVPHFMDEPMNGLDRGGIKEMRELFFQMKNEEKIILLASHNREDIDILCDEVYQIENGILIKE